MGSSPELPLLRAQCPASLGEPMNPTVCERPCLKTPVECNKNTVLTCDLRVHRHTHASPQTYMQCQMDTKNGKCRQLRKSLRKNPSKVKASFPETCPTLGDTSLADHQLWASFVYSKPYYSAHFRHIRSACVSGLVLIPFGIHTGVGTLGHEDPITPSIGTDWYHLGQLCAGQAFP